MCQTFNKKQTSCRKRARKASDLDSNLLELGCYWMESLREESGGRRHGWDGAQFGTASVVKRLDARRRKDPHPTSTASPPAQGARAVQQVDEVPAQEVQVGGVRGGIVTEGVSQAGFLQTHTQGQSVYDKNTGCWMEVWMEAFCGTPGSSRRAGASLSWWECRWAVWRDSREQFL